jgi:quercetin dioxygenase-like cupin family protein
VKTKTWIGLSLAGIALTLGAVQTLQAQSVKRVILQRTDLSVPGREVVQGVAELEPGGATGRHTHPGEEVAYVLEGTLTLEVDGSPPKTYKAGEYFVVPAGTVHNGKNASGGAVKVLGTWIVEKGKPLASPAS